MGLRRLTRHRYRRVGCASSSPASPASSAPPSSRRLREDGHELRGLARDPPAYRVDLPVVTGDAVSGEGLDEALDGIDVAYYLIHSMERGAEAFATRERAAAERFVAAAARRVCGGWCISAGSCPPPIAPSPHLRSRLAVEEALLGGVAGGGRAACVDRHRRHVALVPLPRAPRRAHAGHAAAGLARAPHAADRRARRRRAACVAAATTERPRAALSLDIAGPDVVTYGEIIERIREALLVGRASLLPRRCA